MILKATKNLETDHEHILKLTDIMIRMTQSEKVKIKHLKTVVKLIRNFADGLHHAKEETLLFPKMTEKGFPKERGPVSVMLMEHEQGRAYVRSMDEYIEIFQNGDQEALKIVFENMQRYADLLKNHIYKENNILFRMADGAFSTEEQKQMLDEFEDVEANYQNGRLSEFIKAIAELDEKYPIR
jgi:hemerythrin-like domain-containing protein